MSQLDLALRALLKERGRLKDGQTRLTRKNARTAVLRELRRAERLVNKEYPSIRPPRDPRTLYVIEVFMEIERIERRLYENRWRRLKPTDPAAHNRPFVTKAMPLKLATKHVLAIQKMWGNKKFRLRECGTKHTILAVMLAGGA